MSFPSPTPKQARLLWYSVTALAAAVLLAVIGVIVLGGVWLVNQLSGVLLPLAIAGVLACLLDPVVDFLERQKIPRPRAILMVFFLAVAFMLILLATVAPQLVVEIYKLTLELTSQLPQIMEKTRVAIGNWLATSPLGTKARLAWNDQLGKAVQSWLSEQLPVVTAWLMTKATQIASSASFLAGLALVPVYVFYFLLEKYEIKRHWTEYLPLHESRAKQEAVFVLQSINDCLIVFFRGQVLVALADGALLTVGFLCLGLNYAFLLGLVAGMLSIVPYLGIVLSLVPTVILAIVQFGDWLHPLLVIGVFGLVQLLEGLFISPRIMGDRVGLHPLTIIIAVMVGTTPLGGVLGGVLAIPLTAALRTLMFRYVWKATPARARKE